MVSVALVLHLHKNITTFFLWAQQGTFLWVRKGFLWVCFMGYEITWNSSCFCWGHFDGKVSANNILYTTYYGLQRMKEEQGSLIQQKNKSWLQQGLNPWLQGDRPASKPLTHIPQRLVDFKGIILLFYWICNSLWMLWLVKVTALCAHAPSWRLQSMQAFFMNLVPSRSCFFLQKWSKSSSFAFLESLILFYSVPSRFSSIGADSLEQTRRPLGAHQSIRQ